MWTAYHPSTPDDGESFKVTVDGHEFLVTADADRPGAYSFDWLTGPHAYGFSSANSNRTPMTIAEIEDAIRSFLAQIDPVTGYIED